MTHPNDRQLLTLAKRVIDELPFDDIDIANMNHIARCQACYELLMCTMAVRDVSEHMGDFPAPAEESLGSVLSEKITAVLRLVIDRVKPLLFQPDGALCSWSFDRPLAMAGTRGSGEDAPSLQMLEDLDNSRSFVAYDHCSATLIVQLDAGESLQSPQASVKASDGTLIPLSFEAHSGILRAEIRDLPEDIYEIILEK